MTHLSAHRRVLPALALVVLGLPAALLAGGPATAALGLAAGGVVALHAMGLALAWRADRVLNFAQVALGLLAGTVLVQFAARRQWLVWLHDACGSCVPAPRAAAVPADPTGALAPQAGGGGQAIDSSTLAAQAADGWLVSLNGALSLLLAVVVGVGGAWLIHRLVISRLSGRPGVVATVATVGVGQVLAALAIGIPALLGAVGGGSALVSGTQAIESPVGGGVRVGDALLTAADLAGLALAAGAAVGIGLWMRRGTWGVRLRAVAEAPDQAAALGVDPGVVSRRAWVLAGALSTASGLLAAVSGGLAESGLTVLAAPLAAAVVAGLGSVGLAAVAGVGVGLVQQAGLAWTDAPWPGTLALLAIAVIALAAVRRDRRAGEAGDLAGATAEEVRALPPALAEHPPIRAARRAIAAAVLIAVVALPLVLGPSQVTRLTIVLAYALVGLSVLVLTGWAGHLTLGQFGFAAIGAWTLVAFGLPLGVGVPVAVVVVALAAGLLGLAALRMGGVGLGVVTLLLATAVTATLLNPAVLGDAASGALKRPGPLAGEDDLYWAGLVALALATAAVVGLRRSRFARVLIAARENPDAAAGLAVDVGRARLTAFALSGGLAATGGVLLALAQSGVRAEVFGPERGVELLCVVVIGGLGAVSGPLLGAAYLGVATLTFTDAGVSAGATGLGLVLAVLFAPGGLAALAVRARDAAVVLIGSRAGLDTSALGGPAGAGARLPLAPVKRPVPWRYRLASQWLVEPAPDREGGTP